ncbi:MAG TPA: YqgE/AlgH family protein [Gammaproteobacteria bacterium]|nr:YqgE/AlgH family protein [Gammaproteobacteria bacterium]
MSRVAQSLTNHFLIAMPTLADPNFVQTVTYICEHSAGGALGIVINRPLDMRLRDILDQLKLPTTNEKVISMPVYAGGPVLPERGFVLHTPHGDWDSSLKVTDEIAVTTSRDILVAMARGEGPERALVALGYAGWGAGQLESEIAQNAWLSAPADTQIIFETPYEKRWQAAARLIGVDPTLLTGDAGHA